MVKLLLVAVLVLAANRLWRRRQARLAPPPLQSSRADRHTFEVTLDDKRRAEAEARGWKVMDGGSAD